MKRHYKKSFFEVLEAYPTDVLLDLLTQGNNPGKLASWIRAVPEQTQPHPKAYFVHSVWLA